MSKLAALLDLNSPQQTSPKPKPKRKIKAGLGLELNPMTEVEIKETTFNPNDYKVDCGDLSLYCAAMFGGPLF